MLNFFDLSRQDLIQLVGRPVRAGRVFKAVYQERASTFSEIRQIPEEARRRLGDRSSLALPLVDRRFQASDGTRRYLLATAKGDTVESVLIPSEGRVTFCVSSQIGCALGCTFCLTGQLGLIRDLTPGEIVAQVVVLASEAARDFPGLRYSIVLMGMGEPLQNYSSVMKAISIVNDDCGLAVPASRITLSTAGLVPGIDRLARERIFPNLCISLTGGTNTTRDALMPVNRRYPIEAVVEAVRRLPPSRQNRVMFECVMIAGITDSDQEARSLTGLLRGTRAKVNLIPLNEAPEIPYTRSKDEAVLRFQRILIEAGVTAFIRRNRGNDVSGACGQLMKRTKKSADSQTAWTDI